MTDERKLFQQVVGNHGGPAFVRRARNVQAAFDGLLNACRRQRDDWLAFVRLRLGTLRALAGSWDALTTLLPRDEVATLERLHSDLQPKLRLPVAPTTDPRAWRHALAELAESIDRFNRRWLDFVVQLDLNGVNELREGYNRFYLMEKECALGSARLARQGFFRLEPLKHDDILALLPALPALTT